jgi:hypothetical protein
MTTRSLIGAVVYETGGVPIANGFIRLLGSGANRSLQQTHQEAGLPLDGSYPDILLIADDMLGGLFALNGGRFGPDRQGQVFHLAADDLVWAPLDIGYADFVFLCLTGDLNWLYSRLCQLQSYVIQPRPAFEKAYSFYPFLWTKESTSSTPNTRVINATENLRFRLRPLWFRNQLDDDSAIAIKKLFASFSRKRRPSLAFFIPNPSILPPRSRRIRQENRRLYRRLQALRRGDAHPKMRDRHSLRADLVFRDREIPHGVEGDLDHAVYVAEIGGVFEVYEGGVVTRADSDGGKLRNERLFVSLVSHGYEVLLTNEATPKRGTKGQDATAPQFPPIRQVSLKVSAGSRSPAPGD